MKQHIKTSVSRRMFALGAASLAATAAACMRKFELVELGGSEVRPDRTILEALEASSEHGVFVKALKAAKVQDLLTVRGPLTVFAPTDSALEIFEPAEDHRKLRDDFYYAQNLLRGHIVEARVMLSELSSGAAAQLGSTRLLAMNDEPLWIERLPEDGLQILDARERAAQFLTVDAEASNGIIHSIDNPLLAQL